MDKLPIVLDLTGTFVFALSGALAGARRELDLFGVLVLSFAAGNSGGITRDLLIGAVPPGAVGDWRYLGVSLVAGLITFYCSPLIVRMSNPILIFDAAGLALFAVAGSSKALSFGLNPLMATVLGVVTGIGGGMVRDVLLAEIPTVLRAELYAVAALVASAIVVVGHMMQLPVAAVTSMALISCFLLRVVAIRRGWRLPVAKIAKRKDADVAKRNQTGPGSS
ncbi:MULTISPECIES: trimeric intracellular cation channel family protein [unclassified Bradyrhizobium]|uniref:trimeric intracellular cation channel family protein n=1 Tax=unclassified Bradyrhizobium TaxID=2631580 RepID=UPI001FF84D28|nr:MULTISPECIES: trimeric intracellular cation channel family protein [unclassified Bradyrhizobium]MCK1296401.1 trimeric intracellular cation channel family protein [Bradyrhizobium sp. 30]MCK1316587.1 trimeric intracellular cation channel family protein [Bradyrhizobium sp. 23]MCK1329752.1 trimeric intracellular cation channel family protein [Bradyrhizobium sp. CW9]MCK1506915.1 trimeric intracellular cation channel family protein [Bradyrhizobium sp. 18]MCK1612285.1 trimeric intracellular cation